MSDPEPSVYVPPSIRDYWEILRVPVILAVIAIALTWAVWYLTSTACLPELAKITGCNQGQIARYISLDALNKILTHAAIAGGGGGLWSYAMITRERKAREALEKQLAEERSQAAEERARAAEERRQLLATIELLTQRLTEWQNGGDGQRLQ